MRRVLDPYGIDPDVPLLVACELATNAVKHAQTPFQMSVTIEAESVRIEVQDSSAAELIELASHRGGYGLLLVERAATEWGVEKREGGKAVWVKLPRV